MDIISNKEKKEKLRESVIKMRERYPGRVPVFILKSHKDKLLPDINCNKFIVPEDISVTNLMALVRSRLSLGSEVSMFFFINETVIPCGSDTVGNLYNTYKNEDNILLIYYCGENVFGRFL